MMILLIMMIMIRNAGPQTTISNRKSHVESLSGSPVKRKTRFPACCLTSYGCSHRGALPAVIVINIVITVIMIFVVKVILC